MRQFFRVTTLPAKEREQTNTRLRSFANPTEQKIDEFVPQLKTGKGSATQPS